ncbi:MAG: hypothetical protein ACRELB_02755, partial [Polyangiaceae bacterium]
RAMVLGDAQLHDEKAQRTAHDAARGVAVWAFSVLDDDPRFTYVLDAFHERVVLAPGAPAEVEVRGHILHRGDVRRGLDDQERKVLEEVTRRLASVGVKG